MEKNKDKLKTQIIEAFKKSFHYIQNQLLIFFLGLYQISLLPIAFSPRLPLSSESQWKHPNRERTEICAQAEKWGFAPFSFTSGLCLI